MSNSEFQADNTEWSLWYIVTTDDKWGTRAVVADIITSTQHDLYLKLPKLTEAQLKMPADARKKLKDE